MTRVSKYVPPVFKAGEPDLRRIQIEQIQTRLNELGCGPLIPDGIYGHDTESSVKLYQTRVSLEPDGVVGYKTWSSLFDYGSTFLYDTDNKLLRYALSMAYSQLGIKETSTNRGPKIDEFVRSVGLDPLGQYPWCYAFVYYCFDYASSQLGRHSPLPKTGLVVKAWEMSMPIARKPVGSTPKPGWIGMIDHGFGKGHCGIVIDVVQEGSSVFVDMIEGNTNAAGSREGTMVLKKTRKQSEINLGYLDYSFYAT